MELNEILENITTLKNCDTIDVFSLILIFVVGIAVGGGIYCFIDDKFAEAPVQRYVLQSIALVLTSVAAVFITIGLALNTDTVFRFKRYVETDYSVSQLTKYFEISEVTVVDGKTLCCIEPRGEYHKAVMDYALQQMSSEDGNETNAAD